MKKIVVGFLMSYDYEKLRSSIPPVYNYADVIYLALDEKQRTWKGNTFNIDDEFFEWLKKFDVDNKIIIYKDNFYIPELTTIQNDTRERYMLSKKMGIGNWLIQIDADEFFIDFKNFVETLKKHNRFLENPKDHPVQIAGFLINIYKYLETGLLYVNEPTKVMLATNYPNYKYARNTKERVIYTNNVLLHECLSRTEKELKFKFENWGHSDELNPEFFDKWRKANETNYKSIKNVFYLDPDIWKGLGYFPTQNLKEIKDYVKNDENLKLSSSFLIKKNFGQWFKFLKIFKRSNINFESYFKS
ncbi:hypothetical protein [Xanthomarina sp. GH4-25]|uniref:hypothetical protein n=1 Tax=Xanthomarina sp. GH4-25 TaxID=3349335 RepID=UPI000D682153|nr:hypothetical protein DI383_07870 [Flavobacteriaceae bacterium LYZ1037]